MHYDDDLDIGGSGEFVPYLKFNAKTGVWTWRGDGDERVVDEPRFAMDLANIQTGWLRFDEGTAPDRVIDKVPGLRGERPTDRHKRGFVARVYSRGSFNGVGELSSNATGFCSEVRELHRAFKSEVPDHPDEVPVVKVTGSTSFRTRFGTNFSPRLAIVGWIKRPDVLPDEPVVSPNKPNGDDKAVRPKSDRDPLDDILDDEIPF